MFPDAERLRSLPSVLRARLLMAGAFLGALLTLGLSIAFSWTPDPVEGRGKLPETVKEALQSPPRTCLSWTQPDARDARKVDCAQPHLFEVTKVVDISAEHPPGTPTPPRELRRQISQARCSEGISDYLGRPLDPYGRLTVNLLWPTGEQWADGERMLRCGIQWEGPGGGLQLTSGAAQDQQQSYVWEVGTCLALNGKTVGDPIDCAQQHSYEITAKLDLKTKFPETYPSQTEQKAWLDIECARATAAYTDAADLAAKQLILTWDVREQESWVASSTVVNCKAAAKLPDASGLAAVQGSIKGTPGVGDSPASTPGPASPPPNPAPGG